MNIASIIDWVTANWDDIVKVILQVIGFASVVVRLTPTLADDNALKGIVAFLGKYIALNTNKGTASPKA